MPLENTFAQARLKFIPRLRLGCRSLTIQQVMLLSILGALWTAREGAQFSAAAGDGAKIKGGVLRRHRAPLITLQIDRRNAR